MKQKKSSNPLSTGSLPVFANLTQCVNATGIPLRVLKDAKRAGCLAFTASSRVELGPLLRWLFSKSGDEAELDWGTEFKKWQAKREKIAHDQDTATLISKDEVSTGIKAGVALMFSELDRLFLNELPPALKGLDELAIKAKATESIHKLRATLREKFGKLEEKE